MSRIFPRAGRLAWFYTAVFLSSFLLFLAEPMFAKALLPAFGGSYLVWGAAMVFFQAVLLLGYVYSHIVQVRWGVWRYALAHLFLLLVPFVSCPFDFNRSIAHGTGLAWPVFSYLLLAVGLPFFVLSTTSLILQRWLAESRMQARENPYVLYAASNAGSVLALLAYPVLIEPFFSLAAQGVLWWWGYAMLVILHVACFPFRSSDRVGGPGRQEPHLELKRATWQETAYWFLLSVAACASLLAFTNLLTLDVASVPFLWVLPLVIYMLAFILTFKTVPWYPVWIRRAFSWVVLVGVLLYVLSLLRMTVPAGMLLFVYLFILFVICVNCAGELVACKPAANAQLTLYYMVLAAGGLVGSLLISWALPLLTSSLVDGMLAMLISSFAMAVREVRSGSECATSYRTRLVRWVGSGGLCFAGLLVFSLLSSRMLPLSSEIRGQVQFILMAAWVAWVVLQFRYRPSILVSVLLAVLLTGAVSDRVIGDASRVRRFRNYYGIYKIFDQNGIRYLQHGTTQHGRQYLSGPNRTVPLAYYHPSTPPAAVLTCDALERRDIAIIGLGTGSLAAYTGAGQTLQIFEIDPDNRAIAEEEFSYLAQARERRVRLSVQIGDGRLLLSKVPDGAYDILIVDAFSSGAIPTHLLTVEAFREYLRVVRFDGIVMLHVSNKVLDLLPVVQSNGMTLGCHVFYDSNEGRVVSDAEYTLWAALVRSHAAEDSLRLQLGWQQDVDGNVKLPPPWTDQYCNLLGAIKW